MAEKKEATPEERALQRAVGRAIWRGETEKGASIEEKKAGWTEGRRKFMQQARTLVRNLEREGVTLTPPPAKGADADADADAE